MKSYGSCLAQADTRNSVLYITACRWTDFGMPAMLITDLLLLVSLILMIFLPQPKQGKRPKNRRKPLRKRGQRYRAKDNPFKAKLYGCTTPQHWEHARQRQRELLAKRTVPELHFEAIARRDLGWRVEPQFIVMSRYGEYRIVDIAFPDQKVIFEIIGGYHNDQRGWDAGRIRWIEWVLPGWRVIEMTNREAMAPRLAERILIAMGLYERAGSAEPPSSAHEPP